MKSNLLIPGRGPGADARQSLDIAAFAWCIVRLCEMGLRAREQGACWGLVTLNDLDVTPAGISFRPAQGSAEIRSRTSRSRQHRQSGHDAGCSAFGVPREAIAAILGAADHPGGTAYLLEAVDEAITIITDQGAWNAVAVLEVVEFAIGRRISPRAPSEHESGRAAPRGRHGHSAQRGIRYRDRRRSRLLRGGS